MGHSADTTVAYGIKLDLQETEVFEDDSVLESMEYDIPWSELLAEFDGWDPSSGDYSAMFAAERASGLDVDFFGTSDYSGAVVAVVGSQQNVYYGCEELQLPLEKPNEADEKLRHFLEFLDGKGLRVKDEFRTPAWLLYVYYG